MRTYPFSIVIIGAAISAASSCGRISKSESSIQFARSPDNSLLGTPIGHLEILKSGMTNNFGNSLKICVESDKVSISNESLLLETKLAHVMWLKAAGYGRADFSKFDFFLAAKCKKDDLSIMTSVVLADPAKEVSGDHFDTLFAPAKISCQASAQSFGCRSDGGITLGWGSSASLSHSYFASNPDKWMSISRFAQGSATLSQYVDWMPLSSGLDSNQHLDSKVRDHLKAEYVKLLAMHSPTFDDFSGFASELEAAKAVTGDDSEFQKVFQQLARTGSAVTGVGYRPKYAAFHVLLHEIGHTFGMMHADNPNADSVTGQSSTTSLDPVSHQFKTPISTMAYADQYVYLTEDDRLGISSGAKATSAEVLRHK